MLQKSVFGEPLGFQSYKYSVDSQYFKNQYTNYTRIRVMWKFVHMLHNIPVDAECDADNKLAWNILFI